MKVLLIALLMTGFSHLAMADDEISCATDDNCIREKVEAGEAQFHKNERREARKARRQKAREEKYVPCAGDDDCQRGKLDAIDHGKGEKVDD